MPTFLRLLIACLVVISLSSDARAAVTMIPMGPLTADGKSTATIRLYVDSLAKVRVKADAGKVAGVSQGADGMVTVLYTPPAVAAPKTISLKVQGGGEDAELQVALVPVASGELEIEFDPPQLPSTGTAVVRVRPSGPSPVAAEARRFVVVASTGTIDPLMPAGDGSWVTRYTPPKGLVNPTPVVIAASDAAAPDAVWGHAVLPVTVRRSVSFDAKPGSSNVLTINGRQYGPYPAAPSGKVAFELDLDPRYPDARLQTVNVDTSKDDKEVKLPGGTPQVLFHPLAQGVPAQPGLTVPVRIVAVSGDGSPITAEAPRVAASRGTLASPLNDEDYWVATFTPASTPGEVTLSAESAGVKAERKVQVVGGLPSLTLAAQPLDLPKTATSFSVVARVKDGAGQAVVGSAPTFSATGATASATKDNKDGSYTVTYKVASTVQSVRVGASPPAAATGMPVARVLAWSSSTLVAANGIDQATITLVAVDRWGLPVPKVALRVGVPVGDGTAPPTATTDARGVARVVYTAGKTEGLAAIRVEGGGLVTQIPLWQSTGRAAPAVLPAGDDAQVALVERWRAAAPEVVVLREGATLSGPPATVAVTTVPDYTTPGAQILVTARVADSAGKGVLGRKLTVTAPPATVGPVADNRDGTYTFTLQLPAGTDGPIALAVATDGITGAAQLPTFTSLGAAAVSSGGGSGGASGGAAARPARPAAPGSSTPRPTTGAGALPFRGALSFANTHGWYVLTSDGSGTLPPDARYTAPGAGFAGLSLDVDWLPLDADFGRLGVDVGADIDLEGFQVGDDAYLNPRPNLRVGALYRRSLGGALSFQGALGFRYVGGVLFQYTDPDKQVAAAIGAPIMGARLGVGLVAETPTGVFFELEVAETFVPAPAETEVNLNFDIPAGPIAVRIGGGLDFTSVSRTADDGSVGLVQRLGGVGAVGVVFAR